MFANSGRAQLNYKSSGVTGGVEVLLIHAGVNDRRNWRHVIEHLSSRHRCVAFDMPGVGETTYEREDARSPVIDAVAVLDAADLERPVVVACSMGGQTAVDLALAGPERVAALALIGTAIRGAPYPEIAEGRRLSSMPRSRRPTPAELPPAWPRLGEITVPTVVMIGGAERHIRAIAEPAARMIPGARLGFLDGVAHVPHLEADPPTLDEITTYVDAFAAPKA